MKKELKAVFRRLLQYHDVAEAYYELRKIILFNYSKYKDEAHDYAIYLIWELG